MLISAPVLTCRGSQGFINPITKTFRTMTALAICGWLFKQLKIACFMEKKLLLAPRVLYRTRPWWCLPLFVLFSLFFYSSAQAQDPSRQITGSVADAKGNPLLGVTVSVKGTPVSVTTSADGKYSIAVTGSNPVLELPM